MRILVMCRSVLIAFFLITASPSTAAAQQGVSGHVELNVRLFPDEGVVKAQEQIFPSIAAEIRWSLDWKEGSHRLVASGFARLDGVDRERSHVDIRELYWQGRGKRWEVTVGSRQVFWGVAESNHLVDVLNQADVLEDPGMESKLGQPMLQLTHLLSGGTADLYLLPYFRARELPTGSGRFQPPAVLDGADLRYASSLDEWRPGVALRLSRRLTRADLAVSHYWGYDPEPGVRILADGGAPVLYYDTVNRTGLELLLTGDVTLYKLEALYQHADRSRHAVVAGVEHILGDFLHSGKDLVALLEYTYDSRGPDVFTGLDDDVFAAVRLEWNDIAGTEMTAGLFKDRTRSSVISFARASRRLGASWRGKVEARVFGNISQDEFLYAFRNDTHFQIMVSRHF